MERLPYWWDWNFSFWGLFLNLCFCDFRVIRVLSDNVNACLFDGEFVDFGFIVFVPAGLNWFCTGFYAPCSHPQVSNHLILLAESLPAESDEGSSSLLANQGNRNRCPIPGILLNMNTLESFYALDKQSLLKAEAKKV